MDVRFDMLYVFLPKFYVALLVLKQTSQLECQNSVLMQLYQRYQHVVIIVLAVQNSKCNPYTVSAELLFLLPTPSSQLPISLTLRFPALCFVFSLSLQ